MLDFFWQTSSETNGLCRFLLLVNWCIKPITLLAALGHLRQRGQPTFALPGGISLPTSFTLPGSFPGGGQSQTGKLLERCDMRVAVTEQVGADPVSLGSQCGTRSRRVDTSLLRLTSSNLRATTTRLSSSRPRRPRLLTLPARRDKDTTPSSERSLCARLAMLSVPSHNLQGGGVVGDAALHSR